MASILICVAFACKPKDDTITVVLEDKAAFTKQLADLYFIDSWVSRSGTSQRDSLKAKLSLEFEENYGISVDDFHASLAQLKQDPVLYGELLDSVGVILNKKAVPKKETTKPKN